MQRRRDQTHWHPEYVQEQQARRMISTGAGDPIISAGSASVPSLLAGGTTVVPVTLKLVMGSVDYSSVAALTGTAQLLGALSITSWAIVSTSVVNVTIQNTGILTLAGSTVLVIAMKN